MKTQFRFLYHVFRKADRDDCWGMAAEIGFQLLFVLFQVMILGVALLSILADNPDVFNSIVYFLGSFLPFEIYTVIHSQIAEIAAAKTKGILTLGLIGTIWTMSTLMLTLTKSFQRAYNAKETRKFWKLRGITLGAGLIAAFLLGLVVSLMLLGLQVAHFLEESIGYYQEVAVMIRRFRLPVAFGSTTLLVAFLYFAMTTVKQKVVEVLPGAFFFAVLWFLFTYCFGLYLRNFPQYNTTYGTLGAFLVLMIWMYLTSLSLLFGCELNAELHRQKIIAEMGSATLPQSSERL
jgi:membrane protein